MKRLTLSLAAVFAMAFGSTALAGDDMPAKQAEIKDAIVDMNLKVTGERETYGYRGRRDLLLETDSSPDKVINDMKAAYRSARSLKKGYKVKGWAHLKATDSYTFNVGNTKDSYVIEVIKAGDKARIKIWGAAYKWRPERKPIKQIPRRYAPAVKPAPAS